MVETLFDRKIEYIVGDKAFKNEDFTIEFEIPFDDGAEPNIGSVNIFNLKDSTVNAINKGSKVILNAGYQKDVGAIFVGEVKTRLTERDNVDKKIVMDLIDSGEKWFENEISKTYKKNITGRQILNDLLPKTGLTLAAFKLPVNKVYKSGKTVKGKLAEAVAEVAKDCGAKLHVTRGKVYIRPKNEGDNIRFVLDKDHGLIGSPTSIEKEIKFNVIEKVKTNVKVKGKTVAKYENKNVEKSRTVKGWAVKMLLNHRITTDAVIEIKSNTANGSFRVESGSHKGNNSSFFTEVEVYPL